ncbi:hypothetical protein ACWGLO_21845 [Streptomyces niveus]
MQTVEALYGAVGVLVGAVVTGFFAARGPLLLERERTRNQTAREGLSAIGGVRSESLIWLDFLETTILALESGRSVDSDEFHRNSRECQASFGGYKSRRVSLDFTTTLYECLRLAQKQVSREVLRPTGSVSEGTYQALRDAFNERARLTSILTNQTYELLDRLDGDERI